MKNAKIEGLGELLEIPSNRELIASKMHVTTRTIERWRDGVTKPRPVELEKLRRIINGMTQEVRA